MRSSRTILPPFITNFTRCSSVMSANGSPATAITSANLPGSSEPTRSLTPMISALTTVPACNARAGVSPPRLTSASKSSACVPCTYVEPSAPLPIMIFMPGVFAASVTALAKIDAHAVLAARVLVVVVVHVRLDVALQRRVVVEALLDHELRLLLVEAKCVLDGVAARRDRILQPLAAEYVTRGLVAEAVRLLDQCLKHRQRVRRDVLRRAVRLERVRAAGEQLDPVGAVLDLVAHRGARLVGVVHDRRAERILGRRRARLAPANPARRDLRARAVDQAFVDRVADVDVGVAVVVAAHVTDGREPRAQIGLRILRGDHLHAREEEPRARASRRARSGAHELLARRARCGAGCCSLRAPIVVSQRSARPPGW